jgi:acylphosphatase
LICKRCLVSGHVQGVYFRASTVQVARSLDLRGHARNLPDGRVEVLACGAPESVDKLVAWLWQGPSAARVTGVEVTDEGAAGGVLPDGFTTG